MMHYTQRKKGYQNGAPGVLLLQIVIIQRAVGALVFELVAPPLEQIYTKPKQLGLVLEKMFLLAFSFANFEI